MPMTPRRRSRCWPKRIRNSRRRVRCFMRRSRAPRAASCARRPTSRAVRPPKILPPLPGARFSPGRPTSAPGPPAEDLAAAPGWPPDDAALAAEALAGAVAALAPALREPKRARRGLNVLIIVVDLLSARHGLALEEA